MLDEKYYNSDHPRYMKVAVISKSDRNGGGASRVAEDLAAWLNEAGHQADHFIAINYKQALPFQKNLYGQGLKHTLCKKIHELSYKAGFRQLLPVEHWVTLSQIIDNYDIIHFHDLHNAISPLSMALTSKRKPTFFTVHDCSAFTGGCLYPMECEKFTTNCHECPQLRQDGWKNRVRDRTKEVQAIKRWVAAKFPIRYVFPSDWMLDEAHKALKFQTLPVVIPNGLDLEVLPMMTKLEAKKNLEIPENRQVITISAHFLSDVRKGLNYAVSALQSIRDLSPFVVVVGFCNDELRQALHGLEFKAMGYISEPYLLNQVYLASDLMLFCSLADNLPLTVLEAMAASTPIVGFATGGVPEMIQTGRNGILVEPANQEALNQALRQALISMNLAVVGKQARRDVEKNFSKTIFIERHLQLYQNSEYLFEEKVDESPFQKTYA
jgi:glycosyltransferase involved in cell wall biosynthesis